MMAKVFNDGGKVGPHIHWIPFIGPPVPANKGKRAAAIKSCNAHHVSYGCFSFTLKT
jgi:hypothetical protein